MQSFHLKKAHLFQETLRQDSLPLVLKKQVILKELHENGVFLEELAEEVGKDYEPFDLICHVAFGQPPLTRRERADQMRLFSDL